MRWASAAAARLDFQSLDDSSGAAGGSHRESWIDYCLEAACFVCVKRIQCSSVVGMLCWSLERDCESEEERKEGRRSSGKDGRKYSCCVTHPAKVPLDALY